MNNTKIAINVETSSSKSTVILLTFESHLNFLDRFSKNSNIKFH